MHTRPICIIPARGGSKRIPGKNATAFNGKPMIAWPIEVAVDCGLFSRVIVSTDDERIADIARDYGAEVPFMREASLANDHAGTAEVLTDAIERSGGAELACCIYPTAPMVMQQDLEQALNLIVKEGADCALSVCEFDYPPMRALAKNKDGLLSFNWPEHELTRSQDLPELLHDAGMFYFLRVSHLIQSRRILSGRVRGVAIPRRRAVDIDNPEDLEIAMALHRLHIGSD